MGLELRTIHFLPGGRLEISGTANTTNEFTAVRRYALIAGWVGSGTMACPPPEGDWRTSVLRLHATRGGCYVGGLRFRDAVDRRLAAAGSSADAQEPYAEPRPAWREHTVVVLRQALGCLP